MRRSPSALSAQMGRENFGPALWALVLCFGLVATTTVVAQDTTLTQDDIDDIDRQIDAAEEQQWELLTEDPESSESISEDNDLWTEYQKYKRRDNDVTTGERVQVGDEAVVYEDEVVAGDVVSIGNDVLIHGHVNGDAVALGGDVLLFDGAVVEGDAVSIGGRVRNVGNADVLGERVSINLGLPVDWLDRSIENGEIRGPSRFAKFGWRLFTFVIGLLLALLLHALFGRRLDVASRRIEAEPGQSFLVGLLAILGSPFALIFATLLLAITVIGVLLIPVAVILLIALGWAGLVAVAVAVGRRVIEIRAGEDIPEPSAMRSLIFGYLAVSSIWILATLTRLIGLDGFAGILDALNGFVQVFAIMLGTGALLLSRLGSQLPGGERPFGANRPWHEPSGSPIIPPVSPPPAPSGATAETPPMPPPPAPGAETAPPPAPPAPPAPPRDPEGGSEGGPAEK